MERTETTDENETVENRPILPHTSIYQSCDRQINPFYNWSLLTGWKRSLEFEILMKLLKLVFYIVNSFVFTLAVNNAGSHEVQILLRDLNTLCEVSAVFPILGLVTCFLMAWKNKQLWPLILWSITHFIVTGASIAFAVYYSKMSPTLRREIRASHAVAIPIGTGLRQRGLETTLCDVTNIANIVFPIVDFFIWCYWYCWFRALYVTSVLESTENAANSSDKYRNHIIITNMKL